jgi:hypothetical protein
VLLSITHSARADMLTPGYTSVPHHFLFEAAGDYSQYRFFWTWNDKLEPMDIALGKPYRVDGTGLYVAYIIAVPAELAEGKTKAQLLELAKARSPSILSSEVFDFRGAIPIYDSRKELVSTYRLTVMPGDGVQLEFLGQVPEPWASKVPRFVAGLFLSLAFVWAGFRLISRLRKRSDATPG